MSNLVKYTRDFWNDEEGMGTLEVILIVVCLVGIALIFKKQIVGWVGDILDSVDKQSTEMQTVPTK